jgi:DNA-binding protein YbaB
MSEVDEVIGQLRSQATRMRDLADRMRAIRAEHTASDGAVTVAVDCSGGPVDMRFSSAISRMRPSTLEAAVVEAARQAAAAAFAELMDLIDAANAGEHLVAVTAADKD